MKKDDLNSLNEKIQKYEAQINNLKSELENLYFIQSEENEKKTVSYQLGYILLHETKHLKDFLSLPKKFLNLYQIRNEKIAYQKVKSKNTVLQESELMVATKVKNTKHDNIKVEQKKANIRNEFTKGLTLMDPISEICWRDAFIGFPLVRNNFAKQIETSTSNFAFFESAWKANKGSWIYAFNSPGLKHANAQALLEAISSLKQRDIPIIFWNKEDPMHYEMFKPVAQYADYIFTTDNLIVEKYKKELNNPNVYSLPFAAPVKQTNPLERFSYKPENVCFAGTYYAKNHADRKKQMDMILPALLHNDGYIYNRASKEKKDAYAYPEIYSSIIREGVDFEEMIHLYKKFKVFLNVNTITQSTTMMSRRVYELLASGTPVVSTPSKAITEQFPGIIITVRTEEEAKIAVKKLLEDSYYWHKQSMLGIRAIMSEHTYEKRWAYIESVLKKKNFVKQAINVRIIATYHGYQPLDIYLKSLRNQNNINLTEIILLKSDSLKIDMNIVESFNVIVKSLTEFNIKKETSEDKSIYSFLTDDRVYNFGYSIWGMVTSFEYHNYAAVSRSNYYKLSNLNDNFDFSIKNENWYCPMRETTTSCILIKNDRMTNIVIDIINKKIKGIQNKKEVLLIDPFNVIQVDNPKLITSTSWFNNFIYKTSPYLGI